MVTQNLLGDLIDDSIPIVSVQLGHPKKLAKENYIDRLQATGIALSVLYPDVEFWFIWGTIKHIAKAGKWVTYEIRESVT